MCERMRSARVLSICVLFYCVHVEMQGLIFKIFLLCCAHLDDLPVQEMQFKLQRPSQQLRTLIFDLKHQHPLHGIYVELLFTACLLHSLDRLFVFVFPSKRHVRFWHHALRLRIPLLLLLAVLFPVQHLHFAGDNFRGVAICAALILPLAGLHTA